MALGFRFSGHPIDQTEIPYVAQPPETLNQVSFHAAYPNDNSSFVPGYWFYQDSTFVWRPGYYMQNQLGRVWNAPRYVWTPAGYVYVMVATGIYPLEDRGIAVRPDRVRQSRPLWQTAGWYYQPKYWVSPQSSVQFAFLEARLESVLFRRIIMARPMPASVINRGTHAGSIPFTTITPGPIAALPIGWWASSGPSTIGIRV